MRFFLNIASVACLSIAALLSVACSDDKNVSGIEIGNPTVAEGLVLTAGFAVDYGDQSSSVAALKKAVSDDEPLVLDSFTLVLTEVKMFSSYYDGRSNLFNPEEGWSVWPVNKKDGDPVDEDSTKTMVVSLTEESFIDQAFKDIDLLDGGYLKEVGVSFRPDMADDVYGRVMIDGEYVPFEYNLSNFKTMQLRYHYAQIEIDSANNTANIPVVFRVKRFTDGIDFSSAEISADGVIYIDQKNNSSLWAKLNDRFVPSFQPLRYDFTNVNNKDSSAYVVDVWKDIAAGVGENTIINGSFQSPFTADWILVTQLGGKADTSLVEENAEDRIMKVAVTAGGNYSYSVQLLQENVALIAGVDYKCIFTIWSDVEDSITARIGSYSTYETVGFSKHVPVTKGGQSVEIEFTPEVSDPFARFELNLGKQIRTFWIKDVQVLRLTE